MDNNKEFYTSRETNQFDKMVVDLDRLYEQHPLLSDSAAKDEGNYFVRSFFVRLYGNPLIPLKIRKLIWRICRQTSLDLGWFYIFRDYWQRILGGRPLWGVEDLHFLKNLYRIRFQDNQVPDSNDNGVHLESWQRPEIIYQLLHLVNKESSVNQLAVVQLLKKHMPAAQSLLEFGCATAPVTATMLEFYGPRKDLRIHIADIKTAAFHYAAYRFRRCENVIPHLLVPENGFRIEPELRVDAIFCLTVFEHLPSPLQTIHDLHGALNPGGLLFFDYIKGDGEGLDTKQGEVERNDVLNYISEKFKIIYGSIDVGKSTGLTIAAKRIHND